jgi:phage-related minor tail protein
VPKNKGIELATAYVSVTTDTSKISGELADGLDDAVTKTGGPAGKKLGEEMGGEASKEVQGKLGKGQLGKKLRAGGLAVGVATGAAIAAGFKDAISQADIEGSIKAQLGTTPEIAKAVAKEARAAYNQGWGSDLDEVATITAITKQQTDLAGGGGDLASLTVQAIALSGKFGDESQKIIESASQLVKNGLAPNMEQAMDLIATGYQASSRFSEDGLDSIVEYSTQFRGLGLSGQESMGLVNQALEAGARNGDQASDALKEFFIRGKDGTKSTAEGFAAIGLDSEVMGQRIAAGGEGAKLALSKTLDALREIEDPVARDAAAVQLFGTKAEDLGDALFAMDFSKLEDADISGSAAQFAEDSKTFDQSIDSISRSLTESLGAALKPMLPTIKTFADSFIHVFGFLRDNPVITTILLAIGSAIGVAAAAQWVWNAAALANPTTWIIMGIIAAIALVVAAVWLLSTYWDEIMFGMASAVNWVIDRVNELLAGFNNLTGFDIGFIGKIELGDAPSTKKPGAANGGTVREPGMIRVGEFGPENVYLNAGARIEPLPDGEAPSGKSSRGVTNIFNNPVAERGSASVRRTRNLTAASLAI